MTITLPLYHPAQSDIQAQAVRGNVVDCGRRFGKSTMCIRLLSEVALSGKPAMYFAPTYKMLSQFWRDLKACVMPVVVAKSEPEHRLQFVTGGSIDLWSLDNPDTPRGRKTAIAIVDEAALVSTLWDTFHSVIRPMLVDLKGKWWFFSTPKGLNDFYSFYSLAERDKDWKRWKFSSYANPHIPPEELDSLRNTLPERTFRQEIMADFLTDGSFFQKIEEAAVLVEQDYPEQHRGHGLVMAVDWGLSNDFTICVVGCRECNRAVAWERFNQIDYTWQREKVVAMYHRWGCIGILPERNSIGEPNIEILASQGLNIIFGTDGKMGFNTTGTTKPSLIQGLAASFEHNGFTVPLEARDELLSFEVETLVSGHPKFGAPPGRHDDWVIALALLWRAMAKEDWYMT